MKNMTKLPRSFLFCAALQILFFVPASNAAEQTYRIVQPAGHGTGIEFHIPYSMGTHDGDAHEVTGTVTLDLSNPSSAKGGFKVPIQSLTTGDKTRDCHLMEAMGLDYTQSKYPNEHICNGVDKIPSDPSNVILYPEIEFKLKSVQLTDGKVTALDGEWTIRDVTQPVHIPVKVIPEGQGFRVTGTCPISLSAHHIVVKSAKLLFVTISVEDTVTVDLDLHLAPVAQK